MPLPDDLEDQLRQRLHRSHLDALLEGRSWDVADALEAIMPTIRDSLSSPSLVA